MTIEQRQKNKEAAAKYFTSLKTKKNPFNGNTDKQLAAKLSKVDWNKPISQLSYTD